MVDCDLLAVSGGFSPVIHLQCQAGGKAVWDDSWVAFVPRQAGSGGAFGNSRHAGLVYDQDCGSDPVLADQPHHRQKYAATMSESHPKTWVKNDHLGFNILYLWNGSKREYIPDFITRYESCKTLVLNIKGQDSRLCPMQLTLVLRESPAR